MNEEDLNDPDFRKPFDGNVYDEHMGTKPKSDPYDLFYCPTCIGLDALIDKLDGPLCRL